jgi:hypothetical protein
LNRTHRIVAVILWCTIVVLLAIALAVGNKPLAAGALPMLAGDSFLAAQSAPAGTIHVDACDPGPGEYNTLTGARTAASPGDTIVIHGGSYPETLDIDKALTLTASDGPALVGEYYVASKPVSVTVTVCPDCWEDLPFDANAIVYYPSDSPGGTQIACGGPFPVVVYAHGRRDSNWPRCEGWSDPGHPSQDYKRAEGILTRLAASGIIAISVDHFGETVFHGKGGIVVNTIAYLRDEHQASGSWLEGAVRLDRVGLSGHSTGGAAAIYAAGMFDSTDYEPLHLSPVVQIQGLGLIAPACPSWGVPDCLQYSIPSGVSTLTIYGTKDPPCQVGNSPVEVYREANRAKHLVVVAGANHFGYTDGICLKPAEELCPDLPWDPGWDSSSEVGGAEGQEAHARQQLAAANYLQAFFSKYLQGNDDALDYLAGEQCDLPPGDPPNWEAADSQPVRLFDDLEDLNVQVWVFSCLE